MLPLLALLSISAFATDIVVYTALHESPSDSGATSNLEIFTMNLADKKPTRVTFHKAQDHSPVLHPNGKLIAFESDRYRTTPKGDQQIILKTLPNGKEELLDIGNGYLTFRPRFSDDGKYLYFSRATAMIYSIPPTPMGKYKIIRYDLENKFFDEINPQEKGNFFDVSSSPDGKTLAYRYAADGEQYVRLLDLETMVSRPLNMHRPSHRHEQSPAWKSNSEVTILTEYGEAQSYMWSVFQIGLQTGEANQTLRDPQVYDYSRICWFNESEGVMGARDTETGAFQVFSIQGTSLTKLTGFEAWWSGEPDCRRI